MAEVFHPQVSTISKSSSTSVSETSIDVRRGQTILDALQLEQIRSQTELKHKFLMFGMIPFLCMLAIYCLHDMESAQYKIMSIAVAIFGIVFFTYWLYLIGTASQLHCIRLITTPFQPYGNMIFPTQIKHYPSRPIKSMSEMLALRGSSIHIFHLFMGMAVSCVTATAVMLNWLDLQRHARLSDQEMNINYLEQAFAICAVFAMPMIGYFELNVHSQWHLIMHYAGVMCMVFAVWPYAIQSSFSVCSIVVIVVTYISLALWISLAYYYYPNDLSNEKGSEMTEEEMRKKVHRMSVHCLISQTIGAIGCTVALCLYLWNIQEVGCGH